MLMCGWFYGLLELKGLWGLKQLFLFIMQGDHQQHLQFNENYILIVWVNHEYWTINIIWIMFENGFEAWWAVYVGMQN